MIQLQVATSPCQGEASLNPEFSERYGAAQLVTGHPFVPPILASSFGNGSLGPVRCHAGFQCR